MTAILPSRDLVHHHRWDRLVHSAQLSEFHQLIIAWLLTHVYPFGERSSSRWHSAWSSLFHGFGLTTLGLRLHHDPGNINGDYAAIVLPLPMVATNFHYHTDFTVLSRRRSRCDLFWMVVVCDSATRSASQPIRSHLFCIVFQYGGRPDFWRPYSSDDLHCVSVVPPPHPPPPPHQTRTFARPSLVSC